MIDVIVTIVVAYFLYKFIFNFLLPVSKSASQIKDNMREMQRQQEENMRGGQPANASTQSNFQEEKPLPEKEGDYIDFEEVK
ncbi:MAG: DUF4834 family protein [Chitinophagaceae bacterium]